MGPIDLLPVVGVAPFAAVGGTASKISVKVLNLGLDTARGAMTVRLHLSADAQAAVGTADPIIAEATVSVRVAPGKARAIKLNVTWPEGVDGDHYVLASVDPLNTLPETNEANNVATSAAAVRVNPAFVDVRTQTGVSPVSAVPGKSVSLPVSVFNDGNVVSSSEMQLLVWAVPQASIDAGATPAEAASVGTSIYGVPRKLVLPAGRGKTVKLKFRLPDGLASGQYVLVATAEGVTGEADATNNASVGTGTLSIL